MREHRLKTWPQFFGAVADGSKTFELRPDDRGFAVGDRLLLQEFDPAGEGRYTGRTCERVVTYVLRHDAWGVVKSGWCILGIQEVPDVA